MSRKLNMSIGFASSSYISKYPDIAYDIVTKIIKVRPWRVWVSNYSEISTMGYAEDMICNIKEMFNIEISEEKFYDLTVGDLISMIIKSRNKNKYPKITATRAQDYYHDSHPLKNFGMKKRNDPIFMLKEIKKDPWALRYASETLKDYPEIVMEAVRRSGVTLQYASPKLKNNRAIVMKATEVNGWALVDGNSNFLMLALKYASDALKDDKFIVLHAVKINGNALEFASERLKNDFDVVLEAVKNDGYALQFASDDLRNNHIIVAAALQMYGESMEFASDALKRDRQLLLDAMRSNKNYSNGGHQAIKFVSEILKDDKEIILEWVKHSGYYAFDKASDQLKQDREVILEAIKHDHQVHDYVSADLKNDREYILASALSDYYGDFQIKETTPNKKTKYTSVTWDQLFLPNAFKNDRKLFLNLVKIRPLYLKFASDSIKNDQKIVLESVKNDGTSLRYASGRLRNNRSTVLAAVKDNGYSIRYASDKLRGDRKIALEAITSNTNACFEIAKELKTDRNFMLDVVKRFGWDKANTKVFHPSMLLESNQSYKKTEWKSMLTKIKKEKWSFHFTSEELGNDKELILLILFLKWQVTLTSGALQKDKDFLLRCIKINPVVYRNVSEELSNDPSFARDAILSYIPVLKYIPDHLKNNISFVEGVLAAPALTSTKKASLIKQLSDQIKITTTR